MRKSLVITAVATLALTSAAGAQPRSGPDGRGPTFGDGPHMQLQPGDARGVSPQARARWRSGEWRHTWHGGRFGWWWYFDDDWFWFPEPIYPYPDYVPSPMAEATVPEALPSPQHYWYRCEAPAGFYPYVTRCPGGWRAMPATPPPAARP